MSADFHNPGRQGWIQRRIQWRRQKLQEQEQNAWKQCKGVRVRAHRRRLEGVLASWPGKELWLHENEQFDSYTRVMIPRFNSIRAIAGLGHVLAGSIEWFYVGFDGPRNWKIAVRVLTEILEHGGDHQSLQLLIVSDYLASIFWKEVSFPLLQHRPETLSEIRLVWSGLSHDTIAALYTLFQSLPNLKRFVIHGFRHVSLDVLVDMVAFHLEDFSLVQCYGGFPDEELQSFFNGLVSKQTPEGLKNLQTLRLQEIKMAPQSMPSLISVLRHAPFLHTLDLSGNDFSGMSGELLATFLRDHPVGPLKNLVLRDTYMDGAAVRLLAKSIQRNMCMEELAVSFGTILSIDDFSETLEFIFRNASLRNVEIGQHVSLSLTPSIRSRNLSESKFDLNRSLLNNNTLTKLSSTLPYTSHLLDRRINFVCGRNLIVNRLEQTDLLAAPWPVGLYSELFARALKMEEGTSIFHHLLRSRSVPCEVLFSPGEN